MIQLFKHLIPTFHAFKDDDSRYNVGATWTDGDGLHDYYNLELRYIHNSERLALQGEPQPDGSFRYTEPSGAVHTISAERVRQFMRQTQQHATIMCQMLDQIEKAGFADDPIDASAAAS